MHFCGIEYCINFFMKKLIFFSLILLIGLVSCTTEDTTLVNPLDGIINPMGEDSLMGTGTPEDPYQITKASQLDSLLRFSLASAFQLQNDIDLTTYISDNYSTEGWQPINGFSGIFNGNNFTIRGLSIYRPTEDNVGFFGLIGFDDNSSVVRIEIKNLTIEVAASDSIVGKTRVGGLVGYINDGARLTKCKVIGGDENSNVFSTDPINDTDNGRSGGLVGLADRAILLQCASSVKVLSSGGGRIGGLVGMVNTTTVDQCYAIGDVYAQFEDVGGLIGYAHNSGTTISNCYATGNLFISGNSADDVGAFVGATHSSFTPSNCYATGNISFNLDIGLIRTYGYFSGDGDGGTAIFGLHSQTITGQNNIDLSDGIKTEATGFMLIDVVSTTCLVTFSNFDNMIWTCTDGTLPILTNNQ